MDKPKSRRADLAGGGLTAGQDGSQRRQHKQEKAIIGFVVCMQRGILVNALCDFSIYLPCTLL